MIRIKFSLQKLILKDKKDKKNQHTFKVFRIVIWMIRLCKILKIRNQIKKHVIDQLELLALVLQIPRNKLLEKQEALAYLKNSV